MVHLFNLYETNSTCLSRVHLDRERYDALKSWGSQWKIRLE